MMELRISRHETRKAAVQPPSSGKQAHRLARGLEGEHHRGQQRARGAREHRRHAHQRSDAQIDPSCGASAATSAARAARPAPPPIVNSGASVPPEVPLPERDRPRDEFQHAQDSQRVPRPASPDRMLLDVVVADAQRARREVAHDAHREAAERRPPHPVDRAAARTRLPRRRPLASRPPRATPISAPSTT